MGTITPLFPDPVDENQLNFGYKQDIRNEEDQKNWFLS